jgi:hypothetical protein
MPVYGCGAAYNGYGTAYFCACADPPSASARAAAIMMGFILGIGFISGMEGNVLRLPMPMTLGAVRCAA